MLRPRAQCLADRMEVFYQKRLVPKCLACLAWICHVGELCQVAWATWAPDAGAEVAASVAAWVVDHVVVQTKAKVRAVMCKTK